MAKSLTLTGNGVSDDLIQRIIAGKLPEAEMKRWFELVQAGEVFGIPIALVSETELRNAALNYVESRVHSSPAEIKDMLRKICQGSPELLRVEFDKCFHLPQKVFTITVFRKGKLQRRDFEGTGVTGHLATAKALQNAFLGLFPRYVPEEEDA